MAIRRRFAFPRPPRYTRALVVTKPQRLETSSSPRPAEPPSRRLDPRPRFTPETRIAGIQVDGWLGPRLAGLGHVRSRMPGGTQGGPGSGSLSCSAALPAASGATIGGGDSAPTLSESGRSAPDCASPGRRDQSGPRPAESTGRSPVLGWPSRPVCRPAHVTIRWDI